VPESDRQPAHSGAVPESEATGKRDGPSSVRAASVRDVGGGAPRLAWAVGLGMLALILSVAAGMWWTLKAAERSQTASRHEQVRIVTELLTRQGELALARGQLSAYRAQLAEAATRYELSEVRLTLPDGGVLADAEPRRITVREADIAGGWKGTVTRAGALGTGETGGRADAGTGTLEHEEVVSIPGLGEALLSVRASPVDASMLRWQLMVGMGGVVLAGLGAAWWGVRWVASRTRSVDLVRDALEAAARGECCTEALRIDDSLHRAAGGLNALLDELQTLRTLAAVRRALGDRADAIGAEADTNENSDLGPHQNALNLTTGRAGSPDGARSADAARGSPGAAAQAGIGGNGVRSSEVLRACDAMWIGMLVVSQDGRVRYANGAAAVLLETTREKLEGQSAMAMLGDEAVATAVREACDGTARGRKVIEVRRNREGGTLKLAEPSDRRGSVPERPAGWWVLRMTVRAVRREDDAGALVVIEDVTQQRVADESRNQFVAHATHELRTPLTAIRLYVEQLLEADTPEGEPMTPADRARALNVINLESRRLERIVGDMLSVSEIEVGSMKLRSGDVRVAQMLDELRAEFEAPALEKGITLAFDLPPKLPVLQGDRDKIGMALHNLLGNAVKYTPRGGSVTLRVESNAASVNFEVIDTGIGIKPEEQALVFERFYRAKDERLAEITGSGLGLALARDVARLHGGDITVTSELNKGSTFTLTLPGTRPAKAA
jgi:signal transduction histidine kinase